MRLNIIVPCYNPAPGWEQSLVKRFQEFTAVLNRDELKPRLVVVNDGSTQQADSDTLGRLRTELPEVEVVSYRENRGKGYALRQGVGSVDGGFYLVTDTDFPYTYESMKKVVEQLLEKGGIAAGNRDTRYYDNVPPFRRRLSKALRWVLRNVMRQPIDDSQCGLKAFDEEAKDIFVNTGIDRYLFDLEFLMKAKGRVVVTPVPVELRTGVEFSKVGLGVLATEGRNFLWLLFRQVFTFRSK